jgi:GTP cyclohydrolase II
MLQGFDHIVRVGRAVDALRRGGGVIVLRAGAHQLLLPAEFLGSAPESARHDNAQLLITAARANSLGLKGHEGAVMFPVGAMSHAEIMALADPTLAQHPPHGLTPQPGDALLIQLVKYASLLPAALLYEGAPGADWPVLDYDDLQRYASSPLPPIIETASAQLPIAGAEQAHIRSFRALHATSTHLLLTIGDPKSVRAPLARVHSSCITGDILGSLRCDCGDQLHMALDAIKQEGAGLLLYLHQEGRGIGITNKIRAYKLQEMGVDTYTANQLLGYEDDERDFSIAAAMLRHVGMDTIRLLTNNPSKLGLLARCGITVSERVPLIAASGAHNHHYIEAKSKKAGHLF